MTLRAVVLLALAALAFHEARDVIVLADDRVLDGHHALIALPALLAIALVTFTTRPLIGAATALVRGMVHAPRARPTAPPILLVVPGPRAARGRGPGRVRAGRAPPAFG
jgi:hypothetical protein